MKFDIKHRYNGAVIFTAKINCEENASYYFKLGLAVKCAVKSRADLRYADLRDANLLGANLRGANLRYADLRYANLRYANLLGANLRDANLLGANLRYANLRDANLRDANLLGANLLGANLRYADLRGAKLPHFQIPQDGELTVWKSCDNLLLKLLVKDKVKRTASVIGRKCRAQRVTVLEIYDKKTGEVAPKGTVAIAKHDSKTEYRKGHVTRADRYDDNPLVECTNGIHFFLTREEAEEW